MHLVTPEHRAENSLWPPPGIAKLNQNKSNQAVLINLITKVLSINSLFHHLPSFVLDFTHPQVMSGETDFQKLPNAVLRQK